MVPTQPLRVFVFSKTAGYRHTSIPAGVAAIRNLGSTTGKFTTEASEDAEMINDEGLRCYDVVLFLNNTGDFLSSQQLAALRAYVQTGKGFVGVHAAAAGMAAESWYGELIGACFNGHPEPQSGCLKIECHGHPVNFTQEQSWDWFDEWYNFKSNPRDKVTVTMSIDEKGYTGGTMGVDHPISWCRDFEGARTFYTSLGHFDEAYEDERFMAHLLNGILWAGRVL